jgi:hypothetical protein
MRKPTGSNMSKAQAQKTVDAFKKTKSKVISGVKKVGKVAGKVASAPFKWAGGQIEKEMRMDKAKDDAYRSAGAKLNAEASGLSTKKNLDMLKRGMQGKKK